MMVSAIVLGCVGACSTPYRGAPANRQRPTFASTQTRTTRSGPLALSDSDLNSTLHLRLGSTTALRLSSSTTWAVPSVSAPILRVTPVAFLADPGYEQWDLTTLHVGMVVVTVLGSRGCLNQSPCMPSPITYRVTLIIE